ncbi:hypothetical protein ABTY98_08160 [Streptomyces sp. NPDC096040]|uniref:hypothetical protein n=1 Tax=Streptomyces sp. NPDC096040 TaxID=3155541 RepID=UPI0033220646
MPVPTRKAPRGPPREPTPTARHRHGNSRRLRHRHPRRRGPLPHLPSPPEPNGWQPEGIAIGAAPYAYLGSLTDGSIYRADLRTGTGKVISTGPGTPAVGLELDARGRLYLPNARFTTTPTPGTTYSVTAVDA